MGQGRNSLRSRLLVGVATLALGAPTAQRALAQQAPDKFQPHVEAGGLATNDNSRGDVDFFLPLWQDPTSLLFGDLRGQFTTQSVQEGNLGLGYRTQVDPEWILGGYGFLDIQHSREGNLFYQGTVGLEALSVDWDFRVNGYIPFNGDSGSEKGSGGIGGSGLTIVGTNIAYRTEQEKALFGVDGEIGWRLPIFPADGDIDVRAYAGGFWFGASDVDSLAGPRGRIEVRLYDLDLLGVQSRLTAEGLVQWDDQRGTIGGGGLELRIPLGGLLGDQPQKLSPLDRRMVDRVVRDVDIVTRNAEKTRTQDVRVDGLTVSTHKIVFADATGTPDGSGTQPDPIDLGSAPGRFPGKNEIIVAQGDDGPLDVGNPVQLQDGQALLGGGTPVGVTLVGGPNGGRHITFTPPGSTPHLYGGNTAASLIELASDGGQNRVTGLDLQGSFANGIHGVNMYRAILTDNSIAGGAASGILLDQSVSGAQRATYVDIARSLVLGNAGAGIVVRNSVLAGGGLSQAVAVLANTVAGNAYAGIELINLATDGRIVQTAAIDDNLALSNAPGSAGVLKDGIEVLNRAIGADASVSQSVVVRGNVALGNGGPASPPPLVGYYRNGINVMNVALSGGAVAQVAEVAGNTAAQNAENGIHLANIVQYGGSASQSADISGNLVSGNGRQGLYLFNEAGIPGLTASGGTVAQLVTGTGNAALANASDGIRLANRTYLAGSVVSQSASLADSTVTGNSGDGIAIVNDASSGTVIGQAVTIDPSIITFNAGDGIYGVNRVTAATLQQSVAILDNTIGSNSADGIRLTTPSAVAAQLDLAVGIYRNLIAGNGGDGVEVSALGADGSTIGQAALIGGNQIAGGSGSGILVALQGGSGTTLVQSVGISGNGIGDFGSHGIYVRAALYGSGAGGLTQAASIGANTVTSVGAAGISVLATAANAARFSQGVTMEGNLVGDVGGTGLAVKSILYVVSSAAVAAISIAGNSVTGAGIDGIAVAATLNSASLAETSFAIAGNSIAAVGTTAGPGGIGIYVHNLLNGGSALTQGVAVAGSWATIGGNQVSGALRGGILASSLVDAGGTLSQALTIDANTVRHVGYGGIQAVTRIFDGGQATQALAIANNSVADVEAASGHPATGIAVWNHDGSGSDGAFQTQTLSITGNTVSGLQSVGILIENLPHGSGQLVQTSGVVSGNLVAGDGQYGIGFFNVPSAGASISQSFDVDNNTVRGNASEAGITIFAFGEAADTVHSYFALTGNLLTGNATGLHAVAIGQATAAPFNVSQTITFGSANIVTSNNVGLSVEETSASQLITLNGASNALTPNTAQDLVSASAGGMQVINP